MRIGVIGTGQMGGMLTAACISAGYPQQIATINRTRSRAERLRDLWPDKIIVMDCAADVAAYADILFVCLKSDPLREVLSTLSDVTRPDQILLSTNSAVSIDEIEHRVPCKVCKLIPSVTQHALAGVLLVMYGTRLLPSDERMLIAELSKFGTPHPIAEDHVRIYSDLTSCGPAFVAEWLRGMARAAAAHGVSEVVAERLLGDMILGVGKLVTRKGFRLQDIIDKVAGPGGVTMAGLQAMRAPGEHIYEDILLATATRQREIAERGH